MNFVELNGLVETNACLLNNSLEVMLILGFSFLGLSITLYTSLIFLNERPEKFSLILKENTCACDYLF